MYDIIICVRLLKAHLHHYTQVDNMTVDIFDEASESLGSIICEYKDLERRHDIDTAVKQDKTAERLTILS